MQNHFVNKLANCKRFLSFVVVNLVGALNLEKAFCRFVTWFWIFLFPSWKLRKREKLRIKHFSAFEFLSENYSIFCKQFHNTNNPSIKWLSAKCNKIYCTANALDPINQLIRQTEIKVLIYCLSIFAVELKNFMQIFIHCLVESLPLVNETKNLFE